MVTANARSWLEIQKINIFSQQNVSYVELVDSLTIFFSSFERPVLFLVLF